MNSDELKRLHSVLLIIMDEIDRICEENDLHYTLTGGSLIGAVRHNGFIPWDDDIDVSMLRKDYDKFFELCKTQLDDKFGFINIDNTEDYGYGFGKIVLKGTCIYQIGYSKPKKAQEIWVDIFPYDNIPDSKILRFFHKRKNYFLIKILEEKYDGFKIESVSFVKKTVFFFLGILNKVINPSYLKKKLLSNQIKYNNQKTSFVCSLNGSYLYNKEMKPAHIFKEYIYVPFEDRKYSILKKYDEYLKSTFGNYMELPPLEKRVTHDIDKIDFGKYSE